MKQNKNFNILLEKDIKIQENEKLNPQIVHKFLAIGGSDLDPDIQIYSIPELQKVITLPGHNRYINFYKKKNLNKLMYS